MGISRTIVAFNFIPADRTTAPPPRPATESVESCFPQVAKALGCGPEEVAFTSGGTEANNWAIIGAWPLSLRDEAPSVFLDNFLI